ncbi:hypothetical protein [Caballeronia grimmiae]|uniref:hypothetical protein n=1 Tax=Caballeronia grimmiae TaxID=1071679 RepID=UPI0038BC1F60
MLQTREQPCRFAERRAYASTSSSIPDVSSYNFGRDLDGGLVGTNYGTIVRSFNSASVVALSPAGGLVG